MYWYCEWCVGDGVVRDKTAPWWRRLWSRVTCPKCDGTGEWRPKTEPPPAPPPPRQAPEGYHVGAPAEVEYWLAEPETVLIPGHEVGLDMDWVVFNPAMEGVIKRREELKQQAQEKPCDQQQSTG